MGDSENLLARYPIISEIQGVGLFYTIHLASSKSGKTNQESNRKI